MNDKGDVCENIEMEQSMLSPVDKEIKNQLTNCLRIWNDDVDAGGFFIAALHKSSNYQEKEIEVDRILKPENIKPDEINFPQPIDSEISEMIEEELGWKQDNLWKRGKNLLWSTPEAKEIWQSDRSKRSGRTFIPGNRWRPLRVIHLRIIRL